MKKLGLAVLGVMIVFGFCYAQDPAQQTTPAASEQPVDTAPPEPVETTSFTSQAISVLLGDTYTGAKPRIAVVSDKGEKMMFTLTAGTHVVNEQLSVIMLGDVPEGSMVTVDYVPKPGGENDAILIEVLASGNKLVDF